MFEQKKKQMQKKNYSSCFPHFFVLFFVLLDFGLEEAFPVKVWLSRPKQRWSGLELGLAGVGGACRAYLGHLDERVLHRVDERRRVGLALERRRGCATKNVRQAFYKEGEVRLPLKCRPLSRMP